MNIKYMRFQRVSFWREGDGTVNLQPISDHFSRLSGRLSVGARSLGISLLELMYKRNPSKVTVTIRFDSIRFELGLVFGI